MLVWLQDPTFDEADEVLNTVFKNMIAPRSIVNFQKSPTTTNQISPSSSTSSSSPTLDSVSETIQLINTVLPNLLRLVAHRREVEKIA